MADNSPSILLIYAMEHGLSGRPDSPVSSGLLAIVYMYLIYRKDLLKEDSYHLSSLIQVFVLGKTTCLHCIPVSKLCNVPGTRAEMLELWKCVR